MVRVRVLSHPAVAPTTAAVCRGGRGAGVAGAVKHAIGLGDARLAGVEGKRRSNAILSSLFVAAGRWAGHFGGCCCRGGGTVATAAAASHTTTDATPRDKSRAGRRLFGVLNRFVAVKVKIRRKLWRQPCAVVRGPEDEGGEGRKAGGERGGCWRDKGRRRGQRPH